MLTSSFLFPPQYTYPILPPLSPDTLTLSFLLPPLIHLPLPPPSPDTLTPYFLLLSPLQSQLYEAASEVYKLVIPIYEHRRQYHSMESIYNKLSDCFKNLSKKGDKRFLGSYFRVGFYGWMFGDLHLKEFIYKDEALMKLSEFSLKLEVYNSLLIFIDHHGYDVLFYRHCIQNS